MCCTPAGAAGRFQSTPLHEGRLENESEGPNPLRFQSTPLHEGRRYNPIELEFLEEFQSTPLHEGRQLVQVIVCNWIVSIHAPT